MPGIFRYFLIFIILCFPGNLPTIQAGSLESVQSLDFGKIILDPVGDIIEIDASFGPALPRVLGNGRSVIVGGHSGILRVYCSGPGETITVLFPEKVNDTKGESSHFLSGFSSRSTPTPIVCKAKETIELYIGALLHAKKGHPDKTYEFECPVTVQFDSP